MKNISLYLVCGLLMLLSACSEKQSLQPETQKYSVSFKAAEFTQYTETLSKHIGASTLDDSLKKYVPKLYCRIYKLNTNSSTTGYLTYLKTQLSTDAGFGTINTQLESGSYVAIFVGSGHTFYPLQGLGSGAMTESDYATSHLNTMASVYSPDVPVDEIFYKKVPFTISGQSINQTVTMDRLVAGLELQIEDAIPADITSIQLSVDDTPIYNFATDTRANSVSKITGFFPQQNNTKKVSMYVLATGTRTVTIKAYNTNGLVKIKEIDCAFSQNKKTILKGKLFTEDASFNVTVNPVWDAATNVVTF